MSRLGSFLKKKGYIRIPLALTATRHLELKATINGITGRFLLDTGASNTCVGMDKADFFNLVSVASEVKAAGAGAMNMETLLSERNTLRIGGWKRRKQELVLFDLGHVNQALTLHNALPVDGIIGADVLRKARAVIDYKSPALYLLKRK